MTREEALEEARLDWQVDGVLSVATYIRLQNAGLNPEAVIEAFTNDKEPF